MFLFEVMLFIGFTKKSELHTDSLDYRRGVRIIPFGTLDETRTHDPPLRRRVLYPLSYEGLLRKYIVYSFLCQ